MPDTTPVYSWPVPVLTDDPNIPSDMTTLALAIEKTVSTGFVGDSSSSAYLTGSDISSTAGQNKTIVASTIALDHDQWVVLSGRANFTNTGGTASLVGIYIDVDTTVVPELTSGNVNVGTGAATDRQQLAIPAFSVFLTAGSHTIRLRMDRADNVTTTIVARAQDTGNITSAPCFLSIIL